MSADNESPAGPKLKGSQVICRCTKICGGPSGPGKPRAPSTKYRHMAAETKSMPLSAEFIQSVGHSRANLRTPSDASQPHSGRNKRAMGQEHLDNTLAETSTKRSRYEVNSNTNGYDDSQGFDGYQGGGDSVNGRDFGQGTSDGGHRGNDDADDLNGHGHGVESRRDGVEVGNNGVLCSFFMSRCTGF